MVVGEEVLLGRERGIVEMARSLERGRARPGIGGVVEVGGGERDWPVMRLEEQSRVVRGVVGWGVCEGEVDCGRGGVLGGCVVDCDCDFAWAWAWAWACCSQSERVFGSTGQASAEEVVAGGCGLAAGDADGGEAGDCVEAGAGSAFHQPIVSHDCSKQGNWK